MDNYALLVVRIIPLLLLSSALLIVARASRDGLLKRGHARLASAVFITLISATGAYGALGLARATCVFYAAMAFSFDRWPAAARSYQTCERLGARLEPAQFREWGLALAHLKRWREASAVLLRTGRPSVHGVLLSSDVTLLIGECLYYSGDVRRAEEAIRATHRGPHEFVRTYFLGVVAERRGSIAEAAEAFRQSLKLSPTFFPSFYRYARLMLLRGRREAVRSDMVRFQELEPDAANTPAWRHLVIALSDERTPPPPVEFYVLEF